MSLWVVFGCMLHGIKIMQKNSLHVGLDIHFCTSLIVKLNRCGSNKPGTACMAVFFTLEAITSVGFL